MEILNIWNSGGLWVIPLLLLIGAIISFVRAHAASKSNSTTNVNGTIVDNTGNVPIYRLGAFWFGVIFLVASIVTYFMISADYKGV